MLKTNGEVFPNPSDKSKNTTHMSYNKFVIEKACGNWNYN
jgi:hypothetical protein